MSEAQHLLAAFGRSIGIDDLEFDEAGGCTLGFDSVGLQLTHLPASNQVLLCAPLGYLPQEHAEPLLREMLAANVLFRGTQGATLGADPETGLVTLVYSLHLAGCHETQFEQTVRNFVLVADEWQGRLERPAEQVSSMVEDPAAPMGMRV